MILAPWLLARMAESAMQKAARKAKVQNIQDRLRGAVVPAQLFSRNTVGALVELLRVLHEVITTATASDQEAIFSIWWQGMQGQNEVLKQLASFKLKTESLECFYETVLQRRAETVSELEDAFRTEFAQQAIQWLPSEYAARLRKVNQFLSDTENWRGKDPEELNALIWNQIKQARWWPASVNDYRERTPKVPDAGKMSTELLDTHLAEMDTRWRATKLPKASILPKQPAMVTVNSRPAVSTEIRNKEPGNGQARYAPTTRYWMQCYQCRGPHRVSECPTATPDQKKQFSEQARQKRLARAARTVAAAGPEELARGAHSMAAAHESQESEAGFEVNLAHHSLESFYALFDSGAHSVALVSPKVAMGRDRTKVPTTHILAVNGLATATDEVVRVPIFKNGRKLGEGTFYVLEGCPYEISLAKQ